MNEKMGLSTKFIKTKYTVAEENARSSLLRSQNFIIFHVEYHLNITKYSKKGYTILGWCIFFIVIYLSVVG
jgi:hypothetical protein